MNWLRKLSVVLNSPAYMTTSQMVKKKALYVLAVCFLFAACTTITTRTYGTDFDKTKCDSIVKGKSTKQDIVQLLGEPFNKVLETSGAEKWIYLYRTTTTTAKSAFFQPTYHGRPATEGTVNEKKLEIIFDQDIVKNFVTSEATRPFSQTAPQYE